MIGAYLFDPWTVVEVSERWPGQWAITLDSGASFGFFTSEAEANATAAAGYEVKL